MAVMKTAISWCHSTWNPTVGCTQVTAGCDNCYAKTLVGRGFAWKHPFEKVTTYPNRLKQVQGFQPLIGDDGEVIPRMVFVNSLSDLMHDDIPDDFRDKVFDAMEGMPFTVFQVLTKRPVTMRRYIAARYMDRGVPRNLHLGTSVEDNRVAARLNILRRLKDQVGDFCALASIEPLIGPVDEVDLTGIDQIFVGGESGPRARYCNPDWVRSIIDTAKRDPARPTAVWLKQWGLATNNPLVVERMEKRRIGVKKAFEEVCNLGLELFPDEKGGATIDGRGWRELPVQYAALKEELRASWTKPTGKLAKADPRGAQLF